MHGITLQLKNKKRKKYKDPPCGPFVILRKPCGHLRYTLFQKKKTHHQIRKHQIVRELHSEWRRNVACDSFNIFFHGIMKSGYNKPFVKVLRQVFVYRVVNEGCICKPHGSINVIYPSIWLVRSARNITDSASKIIHAHKMDPRQQIGAYLLNRTFLGFHW